MFSASAQSAVDRPMTSSLRRIGQVAKAAPCQRSCRSGGPVLRATRSSFELSPQAARRRLADVDVEPHVAAVDDEVDGAARLQEAVATSPTISTGASPSA